MHNYRYLPQERHLINLARITTFPAGRDHVIGTALCNGFPRSTTTFLALFAPGDVFQNSVDFINQCETLKLLIREIRHAPAELIRSPQG